MAQPLSIQERKELLCQVYELKPGLPVPLLVQPFGKWYATQDVMENWALDLARQTQRNREQEQVDDFLVPHLKSGVGLGAIAASFVGGCEWNDKSDAWITPLVGTQPDK